MTDPMLDAAIIGAGPAGCAAAIELARGGWRVALFEARAFPRVKPCGEFVSPGATRELEALIAPDQLRHAGARRCERLIIEAGRARCAWSMPAPAWVLSRAALDTLLLEEAGAAGAAVHQPASVRSAEYTSDAVAITLAATHAPVQAQIVIHADGSGRLDPRGRVPTARGLVGLKCHFRAPEPIGGLRMRAARGGYVGTIDVERGLATCALVCRREIVAGAGGDLDAAARTLWPGFDPAWRVTDWLACGVARSAYVGRGHDRSFRVGNAAGATDPVGGEGIGSALWSGRRLARILVSAGESSRLDAGGLRAAHARYASVYRGRLRFRLPACRAAARALSTPRLVSAAMALWRLPGVLDLTLRPWYLLTGKGSG